uniref:Uncharacterized protein n=1 Tax=Anguilla anguilla TaxID=7936 RepID=A0A0E9UQP1_ANGAN
MQNSHRHLSKTFYGAFTCKTQSLRSFF